MKPQTVYVEASIFLLALLLAGCQDHKRISVDPAALTIATADSALLMLTNTGYPRGVEITLAADAPWLSVSAATLTLGRGGTATLEVYADRSGLPSGVHAAEVTVSNANGDVIAIVPVTLNIEGNEGEVEGSGDVEGRSEGASVCEGEGADAEGSVEGSASGEGQQEGNAEGTVEGEVQVEGTVDGEGQNEGEGPSEGTSDGEAERVVEGVAEGEPLGEGDLEGEAEPGADGEQIIPTLYDYWPLVEGATWYFGRQASGWNISPAGYIKILSVGTYEGLKSWDMDHAVPTGAVFVMANSPSRLVEHDGLVWLSSLTASGMPGESADFMSFLPVEIVPGPTDRLFNGGMTAEVVVGTSEEVLAFSGLTMQTHYDDVFGVGIEFKSIRMLLIACARLYGPIVWANTTQFEALNTSAPLPR